MPGNKEDPSSTSDTMNINEIVKALANPARRDIMAWLKNPESNFSSPEHPLEDGVCASEINLRSGLSQSTTSSHLAALQRAGLVSLHRKGKWIFFKRNEKTVQAFLEEMQRQL
ncbi:ArsR/SmtB family transcription factor [Undibacterium sp. TJN25]|uniref:ArsR/SmtB family transcription factor n=1 Tax=Undibacterium sp. TJN25 TaxID=3413056 RepID=UPI003BF3D6F0